MRATPIWIGTLLLAGLILASSAYAITCNDTTGSIGGATEVLRISGVNNTHGELLTHSWCPNLYTRKVYCSQPGVTLTMQQNVGAVGTLLSLSSARNAHAQVPSVGTYSQYLSIAANVGSVQVEIAGPGYPRPTCDGYDTVTLNYTDLVQLSSTTNAHLQSAYNNTNPDYAYTVCVAYNASGAGTPEGIITITNIAGTGFPLSATGSGTITTDITNAAVVANGYSNQTVLQASFICDTANTTIGPSGQTCATLTTYADMATEMSAFLANPSITTTVIQRPATVQVRKYQAGGDTSTTYDATYTTFATALPAQAQSLGTLLDVPSTTHAYAVNNATLGLPPGNYRFVTIYYLSEYDNISLGINQVEQSTFAGDNASSILFVINPPGGGSGTATGGDVFVLKDIQFPSPFQDGTNDFIARVTIEDRRTDLTTLTPVGSSGLLVTIRNPDGSILGTTTWNNANFAWNTFPAFTAGTGTTATLSADVVIETAGIPTLTPGDTYTFYVTADPFVDPTPNPTDDSESVTANNSAFKTFTILTPPQATAVPDGPWWISLLMAGSILGWLFVSSRKHN